MNEPISSETHNMSENGDSWADALAAVVLIVVFVAACVFWVSSQ